MSNEISEKKEEKIESRLNVEFWNVRKGGRRTTCESSDVGVGYGSALRGERLLVSGWQRSPLVLMRKAGKKNEAVWEKRSPERDFRDLCTVSILFSRAVKGNTGSLTALIVLLLAGVTLETGFSSGFPALPFCLFRQG